MNYVLVNGLILVELQKTIHETYDNIQQETVQTSRMRDEERRKEKSKVQKILWKQEQSRRRYITSFFVNG